MVAEIRQRARLHHEIASACPYDTKHERVKSDREREAADAFGRFRGNNYGEAIAYMDRGWTLDLERRLSRRRLSPNRHRRRSTSKRDRGVVVGEDDTG